MFSINRFAIVKDFWPTRQKNTEQSSKERTDDLSDDQADPRLFLKKGTLREPGQATLDASHCDGNDATPEGVLTQSESLCWPWLCKESDGLNRE